MSSIIRFLLNLSIGAKLGIASGLGVSAGDHNGDAADAGQCDDARS